MDFIRVQDVYQLSSHKVANGILNDKNFGTHLTAEECFEIGKAAFFAGDLHHADLWLQEALRRVFEEGDDTVSKVSIHQYLSFAAYQQGSLPLAIDLVRQLLQSDPRNELGENNLIAFQEEFAKKNQILNKRGDDGVNNLQTADYFGSVSTNLRNIHLLALLSFSSFRHVNLKGFPERIYE